MLLLSCFSTPGKGSEDVLVYYLETCKSDKRLMSLCTARGVLTYGAPTAQSSLSPPISELNLPSLNTLMYAIRNDEKSKKKLSLVVIHIPILPVFGKLLLKYFFTLTLFFLFCLYLSLSSFFLL